MYHYLEINKKEWKEIRKGDDYLEVLNDTFIDIGDIVVLGKRSKKKIKKVLIRKVYEVDPGIFSTSLFLENIKG